MTTAATALMAGTALALTPFESGSACGPAPADANTCLGAYTAPSVNSTIALPANGILDYTTFTVPAGYTVRFTKNAANTPVVIRTSGNVSIAGTIDVSAATAATNSGTAGDGNLGDDGQPGTGGPGGFDGGRGGLSPMFGGMSGQKGGAGKGPGGGNTASGVNTYSGTSWGSNGSGGSFGGLCTTNYPSYGGGANGSIYGQDSLLPLIGGSGGGGGSAGDSYNGAGGGGGGGALTIASSGTMNFAGGYITAYGGAGGTSLGTNSGGGGGGGSGGAIRLVAEVLSLTGQPRLFATGGAAGGGGGYPWGSDGGAGRIRLEANTITTWTTGYTSPAYTTGLPGHVFVPSTPTLKIVSVTPTAGPDNTVVKTPVNDPPTGNADITFQTGTTTATVNLLATNIPTGTVADVHVIPALAAARTKVLSTAFNGSLTATALVTLSPGNNILQAAVTYTVTEAVAMNLPTFDNGERVAKIRVEGGMDGKSKVIYITASGKEYPAVKAKG